MELKKWIAVGAVGLSVAAVLIVRGAEPSTLPVTTAPSATMPSTRPAAKPLATTAPSRTSPPLAADNSNNSNNSNNNNNSRNGRNNRRGRNGTNGGTNGGNSRDTSAGSSVAGTGSDAYAILRSRSIFVKGNQNITPDTTPRQVVDQRQFAGAREDQVVFNGVIIINDEPNALVENLNTHDVVRVRPGDLLAGGRVSSITFDELTYVANGRTLQVAIGQDLRGMSASVSFNRPDPTTTPTTLPAAGVAPDASPGVLPGGGAASPPGTGGETSVSDMEAKLRARRLQGN